eukprot:2258445-Amphidinium_carterae.1
MHFGIQLQRGKGTSVQDIRHSDLLGLIHVLARHRKEARMYTAVQVNCLECEQSVPPHLDELNGGISCVIAFGDFQGGELQVLIGKEWSTINCVGNWRNLDPLSVHRVLPVTQGKRYSIVLYNPQEVLNRVSEQDLLRLKAHGFPVEIGHGSPLPKESHETAKRIWFGQGQVHEPSCEQAFPAHVDTSETMLPSVMTQPFPASSEKRLQNLVQQCHEKMGHPHSAQFMRILRSAGASSKVLAIAKDLRCSICQQTHTPVPHHMSAAMPCIGFNQVVGVDLFFIQGPEGDGQIPVLSMICWGTLMHVCVLLKDKTSKRVRKAYRRNWLRVFGPPRKVVSDQGGEFMGAEFCERLETDGSVHEVTPADAPWQNGRTERHGGTVKLMLTRARMTLPPRNRDELEELLVATVQAKNAYTLVGGFSPFQRVFGTQLHLPGGNFGDEWREHEIATMSAIEAGDAALARTMEMRRAAREAFQFVDSSSRVRRSILSGPRPVKQFQPGDQVYFWRREGDPQAFRHEHAHAHWHGPALIVGHHRSKVWLSFRGHLWLCAPEQVREATREERLAHDHVTQDLLEAARELRVEGIGYQDMSEVRSTEPATSARLARPYDEMEDAQDMMPVPAEEHPVQPDTMTTAEGPTEVRGRSEHRQHRSRSRGRAESLLCIKDDVEDEVLQEYLREYSTLWSCSFGAPDEAEWCYITGEAMTKAEVKKRKEINFSRLSQQDQLRFAEAMKSEWENILQPHAAQLLSLEESKKLRKDPIAGKRIIPTRWVLVEKDMGTGVASKAKARLVLQGFKDPDLGEFVVMPCPLFCSLWLATSGSFLLLTLRVLL